MDVDGLPGPPGARDRRSEVWEDCVSVKTHVNAPIRFLGLTMEGGWPTFYGITVTPALSRAVLAGDYPETRTVVACYKPNIQLNQGMIPLQNRRLLLQDFCALRVAFQWNNLQPMLQLQPPVPPPQAPYPRSRFVCSCLLLFSATLFVSLVSLVLHQQNSRRF